MGKRCLRECAQKPPYDMDLDRSSQLLCDSNKSLEKEIASCRSSLQKEIDSNALLKRTTDTELSALRKDLSATQSQISYFERETDDLRDTHHNEVQSLNKKLTFLSADLEAKQKDNEALAAEKQELQRDVKKWSEQVD